MDRPKQWVTRITHHRVILVTFGIAIALLLVLVALTTMSLGTRNVQQEWVVQTHRVIEALEAVYVHITDGEMVGRAFLITGEQRYLEQYHAVRPLIGNELHAVAALRADNLGQLQKLRQLEQLMTEQFQEWDGLIDRMRTGGVSQAFVVRWTDHGNDVMEGIRTRLGDMILTEREILNARVTAERTAAERVSRILWSASVLTVFCLGIALMLLMRQDSRRTQAERGLQESTQRLALAVKAGHSGTFDWDAKTDTNVWSDELLKLYGMTAGRFGGRYADWLTCLLPEDRERTIAAMQHCLKTGEFSTEFRIRRCDDGEIRWMHGRGQVFFDDAGKPARIIGIHMDITERKRADEELRRLNTELERRVEERTRDIMAAKQHLRSLATELTLTEQRERKRIATDLHDYLAQLLVVGRLKLTQARRVSGLLPRCADLIEETERVINDSLIYTRTLMAELSPPILQQHGLPAALAWLSDQMRRHEMIVTVDLQGNDNLSLPDGHAVLLFQSVRELLMNASKYAGSGEARVTLERRGGELRLTVRDHGKGFDPTAAAAPAGPVTTSSSKFGLFSIRERMKALGGTFSITSAPGKGTTATLTLPLGGVESLHVMRQASIVEEGTEAGNASRFTLHALRSSTRRPDA